MRVVNKVDVDDLKERIKIKKKSKLINEESYFKKMNERCRSYQNRNKSCTRYPYDKSTLKFNRIS